ncbi:MAG: biotin--[acetyl-CoA-carboxylase] ligase, partial [Ilumatobacteraceae bacterium]
NDVLVGDAKLAGILAQRDVSGAVVVGIGINVRWAPDGAARLGVEHDPAQVLAAMLQAYDVLPDDIGPLYRASLGTLGMRVRVQMFSGDIVGTAVDVDATGRLLVLDECAITHRIDAGDVVHLRPT